MTRPKCCLVCIVATGLVFVVLTVFAVFAVKPLLKGIIESGITMQPDTYDLWGANPGASKTVTLRNFTFYNFTNPREFLYHDKIPIFHEITGFLYQERSNFTDYQYSEDSSQVSFNYWLYFTELQGTRNLSQSVTILNIAAAGFWSQLDLVGWETFAIQGFGGLFVELNNTIKSQAIGQGVAGQFLANKLSFQTLCQNIELSPELCEWVWSDDYYGLSNSSRYLIWIDAFYNADQDSELELYEHFNLPMRVMEQLKDNFLRWGETVNGIINNWYCDGRQCESYELVILQLSSAGLTLLPPSGDPAESICKTGNITCQGSPELPTYLHNEFKKTVSNESKYQKLTFSQATTRELFRPDTGTLLNIGNLTKLFDVGQKYDSHREQADLDMLQSILHADTPDHAYVIWEYAKYFTKEFVLKLSANGSRQKAAKAGIFSQALYQSFTTFGEWAFKHSLALITAGLIPSCQAYLQEIVGELSPRRAKLLCSNVSQSDYYSYWCLLEPCSNQLLKQSFRLKSNLSFIQMLEYCDVQSPSIYTKLQQAHSILKEHYKCIHYHCTRQQLAIKQFANSYITLNPIPSTIHVYSPELTGNAWDSKLAEFEYLNYLQEYYNNTSIDSQPHDNYTELVSLLSFDKLFSAPMMISLLAMEDQNAFTRSFYWRNMTLLKNYVRFVVIEVGLGGLTMTHTVKELVFGYKDPFLQALRVLPPMLGGDPSINSLVALNEPNCTLEEASQSPQTMYTGISNPQLTRSYVSIFNQPYIVFNKTSYDGYNITSELIQPYKQKAIVYGTDAFQNPPGLTPDSSVFVFISNLYKVGELVYSKDMNKFGFDLYDFRMSYKVLGSASEYPPNEEYYQYVSGFINLTFSGVPVFVSKNHFYSAEPKWAQLIGVYDESGEHPQEANSWDDSYMYVQPTSGAAFTAVVFLQTNFYLQQDELFQAQGRMIPFFSLYRSGNITEEVVDDLFGDLSLALLIPRQLVLIGMVGIIVTVMVYFAWRMRNDNSKATNRELNSLLTDQ